MVITVFFFHNRILSQVGKMYQQGITSNVIKLILMLILVTLQLINIKYKAFTN